MSVLISMMRCDNESNETTKVHLVLSAGGPKVISYVGVLSVWPSAYFFQAVSALFRRSFVGRFTLRRKSPEEIEQWILTMIFRLHRRANLS